MQLVYGNGVLCAMFLISLFLCFWLFICLERYLIYRYIEYQYRCCIDLFMHLSIFPCLYVIISRCTSCHMHGTNCITYIYIYVHMYIYILEEGVNES